MASQRCYCRNWGGEDCGVDGGCCESAFSQQLALHKAFITPKRLRLPKPERDKRCPFICNDVEAGGNWSELRGWAGETLLCGGPRVEALVGCGALFSHLQGFLFFFSFNFLGFKLIVLSFKVMFFLEVYK